MSNNQNRLRIILLYSLVFFGGMMLVTWGFRAIAQEVFYRQHFFLLMWCAQWVAMLIGITFILAIFTLFHNLTNSYFSLLTGMLAIFIAFQLPLQLHPEVRNFNHYRDDYEKIIQNWNENSLSRQKPENYSRHCNLIPLKIESREYCVLLEDNGVVFFLNNPWLVIIYSESILSRVYPCEAVLAYLDSNWILCRPPIR